MAGRTNGKCFPIIKSVCVYWKIIGLCPFVLADDDIGPTSHASMAYTMILTLAYIVGYFFAVIYRIRFMMPRETPMSVIADFLGFSTEFCLIIAAWLYAVFYHEEIRRILKTFKKIQKNSEMMDIGQDFRQIFQTIKIYTVVINVTWFALYITDHIFLYNAKTSKLEIWIPFNLPRVITHNVVLMYTGALWIVKKFFCSLNEKICRLSKEVTGKLVIPEGNRRLLENDGIRSFVTQTPLEVCVHMHSDLVALTKMIVNFFAPSITLVLLFNLIVMSCDLYVWYLMAKARVFSNWQDIAVFGQLFVWSFVHVMETVILVALCDSTANEAIRTGTVLHTLDIEDRTEKYVDTVQTFSLRLLQEHLKIECYGLFEMRFPVLHKIIGMVVTYITIMMQLDIQEREQHQIPKPSFRVTTS